MSILIALLRYVWSDLHVHDITLISHIRFSFQLILASWFLILSFQFNYNKNSKGFKLGIIIFVIGILGFLFFQQSLTGIIAFFGSFLIYISQVIFKLKKRYQFIAIVVVVFMFIIPLHYVYRAYSSFYNIETFYSLMIYFH